MRLSTKGVLLTTLVMAIAGLWGCSSGEQATTQSGTDSSSSGPGKEGELIIPDGGSRVEGRNACRRAAIKVGNNPEIIKFVTYCSGQRRDKVFFALQRVPVENPDGKIEIEGYNPTPFVQGEGAVAKTGRCSRDQNTLACSATIDGPVTISGYLSVEPGTRCEGVVSLVGITSPFCEGEQCVGDPILDELFYARPKGCAAL